MKSTPHHLPIFEKKTKNIEPFERSTLQLMRLLNCSGKKDNINKFAYNSKAHSTYEEKIFIPLYAKDLHLLIKRATKRTSSVEKDFYKLLNNSNFETDCRNNIDNYILEPLYDDLNEVSYNKKFTIFNDDTFRHFFHLNTFGKKLFNIFKAR